MYEMVEASPSYYHNVYGFRLLFLVVACLIQVSISRREEKKKIIGEPCARFPFHFSKRAQTITQGAQKKVQGVTSYAVYLLHRV